MRLGSWKLWAAAGLSAGLLELPFPLAGPMPPWRGIFAWFGLVPLLWAILSPTQFESPRPMRRAFLLSYVCGFLWYCGNCYWVRDTMSRYGDMPPLAPTSLLIAFSLVLGLYLGVFGLSVMLVRRATGSARIALAAAPVLWTALELAAARITSVPWDQLGYSQVDNGLINQLAPWTGVYGISFVLVAVNSLVAGSLVLSGRRERFASAAVGVLLLIVGWAGVFLPGPSAPSSATAVLIQPNLDVGSEDAWPGAEWQRHMDQFVKLAEEQCKTYIAGIPQTGAPAGEIVCPPYPTHPDLVAWPESPAPFAEQDPRFQQGMASIARTVQAPLVVGSVGMDASPQDQTWRDYNSAMIVGADGVRIGRYDKIHLVPFGEYIPFKDLLFFAHKLTGRVAEFTRGKEREVFHLNGHRYGVFICYEAVFADEVRQFARLGAEVLVNISDDGWYGDTSAPWQHLNMARMRAIENRRWVLRDTNNGVTAAIDPYGRVRQSIPRHRTDALPALYGFRDDITFYTEYGDVFAWACAILAVGIVGWASRASLLLTLQIKVRS
ncbi:MAG: apolipoprotein N-acyltransferase [Terracidiphilus sp.]|jgi:apolipoprotein N-acyltransferase